jgi:hypothetical protein
MKAYRYQWIDPESWEHLVKCRDNVTGKIVAQYDAGDPADWNPQYGGKTQNEMLENRGLDPLEKYEI